MVRKLDDEDAAATLGWRQAPPMRHDTMHPAEYWTILGLIIAAVAVTLGLFIFAQ